MYNPLLAQNNLHLPLQIMYPMHASAREASRAGLSSCPGRGCNEKSGYLLLARPRERPKTPNMEAMPTPTTEKCDGVLPSEVGIITIKLMLRP